MVFKFYQHIRDAKIAGIDYPLQGVNILLPRGAHILNRLEQIINEPLEARGYRLAELPISVPEEFVEHLRKGELYKVENPERTFYLSGSSELQAAHLADLMIKHGENLPLRFSSRRRVFREGVPNSLISDIEFTYNEQHAFVASEKEAKAEVKQLIDNVSERLKTLAIPHIILTKKLGGGPLLIYTHFPFSGQFGAIYWASPIGSSHMLTVSSKKDRIQPIQISAGFTNRLLSVYLANNMDKNGFVLHSRISPYHALVSSDGFNEGELAEIKIHLDKLGLKHSEVSGKTWKQALQEFHNFGVPFLIANGRHQIKVLSRRDLKSAWVDLQHLEDALISPPEEPTKEINVIEISKPLSGYDADKVYLASPEMEQIFLEQGLKKIGYKDKKAAFVKKVY